MRKVCSLVLCFVVISAASSYSQVTIGSQDDPHVGAVLDLKADSKGLLLPRVSLDDAAVFGLDETLADPSSDAEGMVVYNTNENMTNGMGKGVYAWDGIAWFLIANSTNSGGGTNNSNITLNGGATNSFVPAEGGTVSGALSTDCANAGTWTITLKTGTAYATLTNVNLTNGTFDVNFAANASYLPRIAVVTVTDACGSIVDFTFYQAPSVTDPVQVETGVGFFSGRTCFDIAVANDEQSNCGSLSGRTSNKADFSIRTEQNASSSAPYSGVQVYTFIKTNGSVSNLRFYYIEEGYAAGRAIESITPQGDYSGNVAADTAKLVVSFKESLNQDLQGLSRINGFKVNLYATYNDQLFNSGTDITVQLTLNLQDCSCCGAKIDNDEWLNFMCFNLGADEVNGEAFTYSTYIQGDLYQWGRIADGHQLRTSEIVSGPATADELDGRGQVLSSNAKYGKFITSSSTPFDWRTPQDYTLWGDDSQDLNVVKSISDPCPAGWKVPTKGQWAAVAANNTWTWIDDGGYKIGDSLFLPVVGYRKNTGSLVEGAGRYWSSTRFDSSTLTPATILYFTNQIVAPTQMGLAHSNALPVRCVSE